MEMLAADIGLTSFTSNAFCRASFLLAAFSCSSSLKEDTVPEEREDDEVDGGEHPSADAPLGLDPVVHHGVPVLAGQNLRREGW
ncbi:hypothetical protein EYF80_030072 [Liparis tanakae]|uniref:Uncharacterized protein n=1 Tax=Liparis tanakae TaxID=230148 RepID=A0A4Z2H295_9TELE|nr:hypothetical protein EYF80_030072 [Liparis tanakae]